MDSPGRPFVYSLRLFRVAVCGLRRLRRRYALWLPDGHGRRWVPLGTDGGKVVAAGFSRFLGCGWKNMGDFVVSCGKIFANIEKIKQRGIGIRQKMGYNRME